MGLALVPLYLRYLGIEAYGLIGVFVLLQAWLSLLDIGLTPTLSREMARFKAGAHTPQSVRDLICSMELVFLVIACVVAIGVILAAPWLAIDWLQLERLSPDEVTNALAIAGVVVAVRWLATLYRSAITGLQELVWLNGCTAIFSTFRGLGVVAILAWISPTIQAFFIYQGVLTALEVLVLALQMRRLLPISPQPARFRWKSLQSVGRFAAGMTAISVLATFLTQVDKVLLSKLLPLTDFGYFTLASTVAGGLYFLIMPFSNVLRPRLAELVACGQTDALADTYHKFSQMLTLIVVPASLVLSLFSDHILLLWTRNVTTTVAVAPLVSVLVLGTMINGWMNTPYALQLAYGKTRFAIWTNTISLIVFIPAIYVSVSTYGAIGAAAMWVLLNLGYVTIALPFMHRTLLPTEKWRWYAQDVLIPTISAAIPIALIYSLSQAPGLERPLSSVVTVTLAFIAAQMSATLVTKFGRDQIHRVWIVMNSNRGKLVAKV